MGAGLAVTGTQLNGVLCMAEAEHQQESRQQLWSVERHASPPTPIMPVLTLPKLPKLTPGKPLDPEQRHELVTLQRQIQAQLLQQRSLVETIRQLPQFHDMAPSSPSGTSIRNRDPMHAVQHVQGPDPVGDIPVEDPEREEESKSIASSRENEEKKSNSTLGTTTKVYVDFKEPTAPEAQKDELSMLLELDDLMKRGGVSGEDTGEPGIESPKSMAKASIASKGSRKTKDSQLTATSEGSPTKETGEAQNEMESVPEELVAVSTASASSSSVPQRAMAMGGFKHASPDNPVAPRRPMPSPAPLKERPHVVMPTLSSTLEPADLSQIGVAPPGREERRWIEAAVRRMFRSLGPAALESITEAFREWKLQPCTSIVKQDSPINTGPGLSVLVDGVVDVLNRPMGGKANEKVCTYDRCGQCFGELELLYDTPRGGGNGRRKHWATIATRTPVTLWTIHRDTLRGLVPGANTRPPALLKEASETDPQGPLSFV